MCLCTTILPDRSYLFPLVSRILDTVSRFICLRASSSAVLELVNNCNCFLVRLLLLKLLLVPNKTYSLYLLTIFLCVQYFHPCQFEAVRFSATWPDIETIENIKRL